MVTRRKPNVTKRRPGSPCGVCIHKHRNLIELGLCHRVPIRVLSAKFDLSLDAFKRHRRNHLSAAVRAAIMLAVAPTEVDLEQL